MIMMMAKRREPDDDQPVNGTPSNGIPKFGVPWIDAAVNITIRFGIWPTLYGVTAYFVMVYIGVPLAQSQIETNKVTQECLREVTATTRKMELRSAEHDADENEHMRTCMEAHVVQQKTLIENQEILRKVLASRNDKNGGGG